MSVLAPLGILILSMLIMAFLALTPGVYALFCHYTYGKYSRRKASDFTFFFILGAETLASCLFLCTYLLVAIAVADLSHLGTNVITWIMVGMLFALALASIFLYYRHGKGSQLFISRRVAKSLDHHAKTAKTRSDAFTLGALACTPELIFTMPLFIITSAEILQMSTVYFPSALLTILYIIIPIIPLFVLRWQFANGHNLAEVARSRVSSKNFTRLVLSISYVTIAILIICFNL